ncbi:MAG: hypothetical protein WBQ94_24970 [Terracidiphilus sp.]
MKYILYTSMIAMCLLPAGASARTLPPSVPPLTLQEKFQIYLRKTYSVSGMVVPAWFAALDLAADSPKEWGQDGKGYLNRLATQRGQFQIGNFCAFAVGATLHEDPRFLPSGLHGTWRRTKYVIVRTLVARTDNGREQPAFANYAGPLGAAFFPSTWLPRSESSLPSSLKRSGMMLGMEIGVNMGVEFGPDDLRFFREKILRHFQRESKATKSSAIPSGGGI